MSTTSMQLNYKPHESGPVKLPKLFCKADHSISSSEEEMEVPECLIEKEEKDECLIEKEEKADRVQICSRKRQKRLEASASSSIQAKVEETIMVSSQDTVQDVEASLLEEAEELPTLPAKRTGIKKAVLKRPGAKPVCTLFSCILSSKTMSCTSCGHMCDM